VIAVAEVVQVTPEVAIPLAELEFRASRASGPASRRSAWARPYRWRAHAGWGSSDR
jgi:hypothetical protein